MRGPRLDLLLSALLTATTQVELLVTPGVEGPLWLQHGWFAVMTAAVAFRRRAPLLAVVLVSGGLSAQSALAGAAPVFGGFVAAIVVTSSAGAYLRGRAAVAGAVLVAVGVVGTGLFDEGGRSVADFGGNLLIFGVIFALGVLLGERRDRAEVLSRDLVTTEQRAKTAAADERARIARELHDVIAHHVSVMTLQAGAARQVLASSPERVREPLELVEEHGRQAMEEMRRLLGILRPVGAAEGAERVQPGLRALPELVEQTRRSGIEVALRVDGEPRTLSAGVDLAAYRIVQEGLTNALKHSDGGAVRVGLDWSPDAIRITVVDDGRGGTSEAVGNGHGLVGMRERAALYGGSLAAGPRAGGGFGVEARLPA